MKKSLLYLLMLTFVGFSFAACSDDDDDDPDYATEVADTYSGTLDIYLAAGETWVETGSSDDNITVTRTGSNQVNMKLVNFSFDVPVLGNVNFGTIKVENIAVEKVGNNFTLKGSDNLNLVVGSGTVSVNGTVDQEKECELTLLINLEKNGEGDPYDLNVKVEFTTAAQPV